MEGRGRLENGISARLSRSELRKFGFTVGAAFLVFGGIARWRGHTLSSPIFLAIGAILVIGGAAVPMALGPVYTAWMGLAKVMSKVTTPLFLGVMYFLVFTPVGIVRRALGKSGLVRQPVNGSYYLKREHRASRSMDQQF